MSEKEEMLVSCMISVTQYFKPNGEMAYDVCQEGDAVLSTQVGLLELAKDALIRHHREAMKDDDEDH